MKTPWDDAYMSRREQIEQPAGYVESAADVGLAIAIGALMAWALVYWWTL